MYPLKNEIQTDIYDWAYLFYQNFKPLHSSWRTENQIWSSLSHREIKTGSNLMIMQIY